MFICFNFHIFTILFYIVPIYFLYFFSMTYDFQYIFIFRWFFTPKLTYSNELFHKKINSTHGKSLMLVVKDKNHRFSRDDKTDNFNAPILSPFLTVHGKKFNVAEANLAQETITK